MKNELLSQVSALEEPLFDPNFLNLGFFFNQVIILGANIYDFFAALFGGISAPYLSGVENFLWGISALFVFGIGYSLFQLWQLQKRERSGYKERQLIAAEGAEGKGRNAGWEKVLDYLELPNDSDWRLAIIEADNLLDTMLTTMGYHGETIGEKLRGIERSDFLALGQAWEAHKIRNRIAHEGSHFSLTHREARRVISLYREAFEEFHFI